MPNQRARFAGMLAIGATILLISILVGTRLGDHVIISASGKKNDVAVDLPTPVPMSSASVPPSNGKWKKIHIIAVATDPAFPDPRLTPTPVPPTPSPSPKPTDSALGDGEPGLNDGPTAVPAATASWRTPSPRKPARSGRGQPTSDELGE